MQYLSILTPLVNDNNWIFDSLFWTVSQCTICLSRAIYYSYYWINIFVSTWFAFKFLLFLFCGCVLVWLHVIFVLFGYHFAFLTRKELQKDHRDYILLFERIDHFKIRSCYLWCLSFCFFAWGRLQVQIQLRNICKLILSDADCVTIICYNLKLIYSWSLNMMIWGHCVISNDNDWRVALVVYIEVSVDDVQQFQQLQQL